MNPDKAPEPSHDALLRELGSDIDNGLTQAEADKRLIIFGLNVIPKASRNLFKIYIAPLLNWMVNIYLVITVLLAVLAVFVLPDLWTQVAFWFMFIALNAVVAIVQQVRAQKKLEALEHISPPKCKVIRDGQLHEIKSEVIVPGDVIKLEQGDRVPADARIIKGASLMVDEAPLTGESVPVEKNWEEGSSGSTADISGHNTMVFLGTFITAGTATAVVLQTGSRTRLGKISVTVSQLNTGEIPLRQKVNKLARYLALAVIVYLVISLTYHAFSMYRDGQLMVDGALNGRLIAETIARSLITSMSVMPINIPLLTTIILLAGTLAMARQQVIIRDLSAVESLGRVSVICTDKTGTLTKNEMTVRWICLPRMSGQDSLFEATGVGFEPEGRVFASTGRPEPGNAVPESAARRDGDGIAIAAESSLEYLVVSGMLNNEGSIIPAPKATSTNKGSQTLVYSALGDTTDASMLALFRKSGLDEALYRSAFRETRSYPFDSNLKRMTKIFLDSRSGRLIAFTKGATEVILPRCSAIASDKAAEFSRMDGASRAKVLQKAGDFASQGYRVISLSFKYLEGIPSQGKESRDSVENDLIYLGFVAIIDPPRNGVAESVAEARGAGIRSVMVTGDSLETARSIARQVGIARDGDISSAAYDQDTSNQDFLRTSVFARVSPEDKMAIVERYKRQNRTVAVTGDGVNDAPALSTADVGIAMGLTGTDVAKQSADMIIADDSFNSVVVGIREGRGLFQKIRSLIFFYIAVNIAEAMVYFGASFIPDFNLLNTWQKIYIFTTVHAIPPLAFIADRLNRDVMLENPRDGEDIFNTKTTFALVLFVVSLASVLFLVYIVAASGILPLFHTNQTGFIPDFTRGVLNSADWFQAKARTMLITVALISETLLVVSLRRLNKSALKTLKDDSYRFIWPFLLLVPALHLLLMYAPAVQEFLQAHLKMNFEIIPLAPADWLVALGFSLVPVALLELYKRQVRRNKGFF